MNSCDSTNRRGPFQTGAIVTANVRLRDVQQSDLLIFYEFQLDPKATQMAAFPSRDYETFMAHWRKSMGNATSTFKTILADEEIVGSVVSWEQSESLNVGYWLGSEYWGNGFATAALSLFLEQVTKRPLHAHVAKHNVASVRVLQKCGFSIESAGNFSDSGGEDSEESVMVLTR